MKYLRTITSSKEQAMTDTAKLIEDLEAKYKGIPTGSKVMLNAAKALQAQADEISQLKADGKYWRDCYSKWVQENYAAKCLIELEEQLAAIRDFVENVKTNTGYVSVKIIKEYLDGKFNTTNAKQAMQHCSCQGFGKCKVGCDEQAKPSDLPAILKPQADIFAEEVQVEEKQKKDSIVCPLCGQDGVAMGKCWKCKESIPPALKG